MACALSVYHKPSGADALSAGPSAPQQSSSYTGKHMPGLLSSGPALLSVCGILACCSYGKTGRLEYSVCAWYFTTQKKKSPARWSVTTVFSGRSTANGNLRDATVLKDHPCHSLLRDDTDGNGMDPSPVL